MMYNNYSDGFGTPLIRRHLNKACKGELLPISTCDYVLAMRGDNLHGKLGLLDAKFGDIRSYR